MLRGGLPGARAVVVPAKSPDGVDEEADDVAGVVPAPGDCQLSRCEVGDRAEDEAGAFVEVRVALGDEGDADTCTDQLQDLVGGGGLCCDQRRAGAGVQRQPEVAEWARCDRQGDKWFVEQDGEGDLGAVGERMS